VPAYQSPNATSRAANEAVDHLVEVLLREPPMLAIAGHERIAVVAIVAR
jgi:hypothetical protein